jgi:phage shock protein C
MLRSIVARDDTLLGACFAVGQDFGFDTNWLRILFAVVLFFTPAGALVAYSALWTVVAFSRWVVPDPAPAALQQPLDAALALAAGPELPLAA